MNNVKPTYKTLLIISIALYVTGVSIMQTDLYLKVCKIEHVLSHMLEGRNHKY